MPNLHDHPAIQDVLPRATRDQQGETARALKRPRSLKRLLRMAERALARADQAIADLHAKIPPPRPIACAAKCPYCCHIRLTASAPEILLVLHHIHSTWDEAEIATLLRKVNNTDRLTRGRNEGERARMRLPCPLLKDGSCSVHTVRPLSCRAVASVDVGACKQAYRSRMQDGVTMYEPQYLAANGVGYGLHAGLADAGYPLENIELVAAMAIGLSQPDIGKAWLKGEDVFAPAR